MPETEETNTIAKLYLLGTTPTTKILAWTTKFWKHTQPIDGGHFKDYHEPRESNLILNIPIHRKFTLYPVGSSELMDDTQPHVVPDLKFYIENKAVNVIIECDYEHDTNPFGYLARKYTYSITPQPEASTALTTSYNIQTSGIVIGANIETHAFNINRLGYDLDVINNEIGDIVREVQQIVAELSELISAVNSLNELINVLPITDMILGLASAGIGAIKGFFAAGAERALKLGEREAISASIIGGEGVLNVGTGFEKVSMGGVLELFELHADSISSQTGTFVSSLKVQSG